MPESGTPATSMSESVTVERLDHTAAEQSVAEQDSGLSGRLRIVGVHGVHHYHPHRTSAEAAAGYARDWAGHLARGLGTDPARLDLSIAYYAPALNRRKPHAQGAEGEELDDELAEQLLAEYLRELGAPQTTSQGIATLPLRHAADWIAQRFPGTTQAFVRTFFCEVAEYLRAPEHGPRQHARETVAELIRDQRPDVVIAHSLGTVVAYEALHTLPDTPVPLLLTLGSPLALPHAVHPRLKPAPIADPALGHRPRGTRPPGVARWVNIADPGDPVAIPLRLTDGFHDVALNLIDTIHHGFGFHHAANYLAAPATAATIGPLIGL